MLEDKRTKIHHYRSLAMTPNNYKNTPSDKTNPNHLNLCVYESSFEDPSKMADNYPNFPLQSIPNNQPTFINFVYTDIFPVLTQLS